LRSGLFAGPARAATRKRDSTAGCASLHGRGLFLADSGENLAVNELVSPFVRTWNWVTATGGFPGQIMFCCLVVIVVLGTLVWFTNRRG
jgi:hypothetical protein